MKESNSYDKINAMMESIILKTFKNLLQLLWVTDLLRHGIAAVSIKEINPFSFGSSQFKGKNFKSYSNWFMKKKCSPYHIQLRNGSLTQ